MSTISIRFGRDFGELEVDGGTSLLAAAARAGAPLGNACRGQGVCRACAVLVLAGAEALSEAGELERRFGLEPGWRMACQTRVRADLGADEGGTVGPARIELWTPHWGGWPELEADEDGEM